jgi:hypothetical protein
MMANSKASDDKHKRALDQFSRALEADRSNRIEALDDARFVAGEQWPQEVKNARLGRPCLTINRLPTFIRQVSNEVRLKPPAIKVLPAEEGDEKTAEVIEGLMRNIEARSKAKRIYAQGIEDAARCGMGFWRIRTDYADNETFDQDIHIEPIANPFGVLFDPDMTDPMGSDAKFCFVIETMTAAAFKAKYPGKDYGIEGDSTTDIQVTLNWVTGDKVQIAEYWCVEETDSEVVLLDNGEVVDVADYDKVAEAFNEALTAFNQAQQEATAQQSQAGPDAPPVPMPEPPPVPPMPAVGPDGQPRTRRVKKRKVVMYQMSGGQFLAGPFEWPGKRIPIVPVWGEVYRVGDRKVRASLIRWAKDSQRMINYWRSASVEALALAPKAPWLVTAKQVEGRERDWKQAGTGNPAVLVYNPDPQAGAPQRVMPAPVQGAMLQESALAQDDLKSTTGIYDASLGAQSNETSGRAIMARQQEGDVSTYAFLDNLLAAVEETGRIILDILPRIYDVPRQIRILGKKMEPIIVRVNDGSQYDLTRGKYDVHITTGPSFTTAREKAAEMFTELLRAVPPLAPVLVPRMVDALDLPDGQEMAQEVRQLMSPQPQQQGPAQPDPKDQAQADKFAAEAERTRVQTMGLLTNMQGIPGPVMSPQGFGPGAFEGA